MTGVEKADGGDDLSLTGVTGFVGEEGLQNIVIRFWDDEDGGEP